MLKRPWFCMITIFILSLLTNFTYAWEEYTESPVGKGSSLFSGGLSLTSTELYGSRITIITATLGNYYFPVNNFGIGIDGTLLLMLGNGSSITTYGIGPKVGYFFGGETETGGSVLYPFLGVGATYNKADILGSSSYFNIKGGPGVCFLIGSNGGVILQAGYQKATLEGSSGIIFLEVGLGIFNY